MNQKKLIKKFLSNQCSAQEADYITQLLLQQPELLDEFLSEKEWEQHLKNQQPASRSRASWIKALCLILIPLGFAIRTIVPSPALQQGQLISFKTYYINNTDTMQSYVLADSTLVRMHPNSKLFVQLTSDYPLRYVRVDQGRVKFEVAKNSYRPFVVEGGGLRTTALGTAFTVYVHSDHYRASIALEEGKVKVENVFAQSAKSNILLPGEQVNFESADKWYTSKPNLKGRLPSREKPKPSSLAPVSYQRPNSITESQGSLWMESTPLVEALNYISYELDMPISYLPKDLMAYKVSGRFIIHNPQDLNYKERLAAEILQLITEVNPLQIHKQHNTYILRNNN